MKRRKFVNQVSAVGLASLVPQTLIAFNTNSTPSSKSKPLTFGVVADVHKDLMPDADDRLQVFIDKSIQKKVDFNIQLGDFCMAEKGNGAFMNIWEQFKGPKYHVLGNHDMDRHSKEQMLDYWGMPNTYYSFDFGGYHFIVLDANFLYADGVFVDYDRANFYVDSSLRTFIDDDQIAWIKNDLANTTLPTIVFSHQSLWHYQWGVKNRLTIQKILEANQDKIICCMNGHNHLDYHHRQNGIDYVEINSMSYQWVTGKYTSTQRFAEELYLKYNNLIHIAGYKDPLYAFATIHPNGTLIIEGVKSEWMQPSPYDMGMSKGIEGSIYTSEISDYNLSIN
jgi:hypothetical protein